MHTTSWKHELSSSFCATADTHLVLWPRIVTILDQQQVLFIFKAISKYIRHTIVNIQCVSKNDTALACYNFHVHQPILIIFGTNVAKQACSQMVLYFPTSSNYCCCTTWGNKKPKSASFHLNAGSCFASRHRKHIHIITWSQLNRSSFSQESAACTKQDRRIEYSMLSPVTTHSTFTKFVMMSIAVSKVGVVPCRASSEK